MLAAEILEQQLQSELYDAWISRRSHIAKAARDVVVEISRWIEKLGVIENIERFCAELQLSALGYLRILQQGDIKVVETRSAEVPPHGVSNLAQWFLHEVIRVEIWLSSRIAGILVYKQRAAIVGITGLIDRVVECSAQ